MWGSKMEVVEFGSGLGEGVLLGRSTLLRTRRKTAMPEGIEGELDAVGNTMSGFANA